MRKANPCSLPLEPSLSSQSAPEQEASISEILAQEMDIVSKQMHSVDIYRI
jgi:hypothetical protein